MSGDEERPTVGHVPAEEVPSSTGQMGREIRQGESSGSGSETTQLR